MSGFKMVKVDKEQLEKFRKLHEKCFNNYPSYFEFYNSDEDLVNVALVYAVICLRSFIDRHNALIEEMEEIFDEG